MDESQIVPCVTCGIGLGGIGDYEKSTDWLAVYLNMNNVHLSGISSSVLP